MYRSFFILFYLFVSLAPAISAPKRDNRPVQKDPFSEFIRDLQAHYQKQNSTRVIPGENELSDWAAIPRLVRSNRLDSCNIILRNYHYEIHQIFDPVSEGKFLAITEEYPIQRGWGTFIFNRDSKKRLYIHVLHPVDETNTLQIGAEVFRRLGAEWLFIDGVGKFTREGNKRSGRPVQRTVFSKWHEALTDITHLTISIRGFHTTSPSDKDIVVSNGRTFDQQWGISQISLAFRDSLRQAGFDCVMAMYDSGYANLAGGSSREGIFSNDSVGFGHWLNIELSSNLRGNPVQVRRFITTADRALGLTGKKVSQEVNRAFGLVSPRVVRVDSRHRILFPPSDESSYRIISFNQSRNRSDTIDVRMGNWLDLVGEQKSVVSSRVDSAASLLPHAKRRLGENETHTRIVERSTADQSDVVVLSQPGWRDTSAGTENEIPDKEPIQTHRIPLKKVPVPAYTHEIASPSTPYTWNGILPSNAFTPASIFQMTSDERGLETSGSPTEFLIPLLRQAFHDESEQCIGVQMNSVLLNEIARLVNQNGVTDHQIGLIAERDENGAYYLRIIPEQSHSKKLQAALIRNF